MDKGLVRAPLPAPKRLRIVQVLEGSSWGVITPDTINRGLGGRETALLQLSLHWGKQGHDVLCFVNTDHPFRQTFDTNGGSIEMIDVRLAAAYLDATQQDVVIAWEHPRLFSYKNIAKNVRTKIVGMQVAHLDIEEEAAKDIDAIVTLSPWAERFLKTQNPAFHSIPFFNIPNGVDLQKYPSRRLGWGRQDGRFFYSSSPDRGLIHLLRLWPRLRKELPDAELFVAYGATRWTKDMKWSHYMQGDVALEIEHRLSQPGVTDVGLIGQQELANLQLGCSMLPYTCDTMSPTETGCITVTEALAAGCPVVTTDCDCLGEEYGEVANIVPLPYDEDRFLDAMFTILNDEDRYAQMQVAGREFAEARSWRHTSTKWMEVINELLMGRS